MDNYYLNENNQNNRGEKNPPPKKSFDFNLYKKNTINSIHDVESFLNHFQRNFKYLKIFKIMKK